MMRKVLVVWFLAISLMIFNLSLSFAQETPAQAQTPAVQQAQAPAAVEADTQWLWGEVVLVTPEKNELTVKYLDYESDVEKDMILAVDPKTTFENIKSIAEIKVQDTVSVDYAVSPEGKSLARNISVEKPESLPAGEEEAGKEKIPAEPIMAAPQETPAEVAAPAVSANQDSLPAQPESKQ